MKSYFYDLADFIQSRLHGGEDYTAWLSGERSDFVRFNHGKVRQAGEVQQLYLSLRLIRGQKHVAISLALTGMVEADQNRVGGALAHLRDLLVDVADDPHLLLNTIPQAGDRYESSRLPASEAMVEDVVAAANGYDFVGFLASGPMFSGFANSWGQRNWHETASFSLDWSLYAGGDKAVKAGYAATEWQREQFHHKFDHAAAQLLLLQKPARTIAPGQYRAYLTPDAMGELMGMMNWDGFSEKSLRTKRSSLIKLADDELSLNPMVNLREHTVEGLAPAFQAEGFIKPAHVDLIREGRFAGSLISPRTAKEYGVVTNGADGSEGFESLQMAAGDLPQDRALAELGTGLYISNLWYLNFSDRINCRVTGMTRFATFWVENGEIVAPLNVMRFDDSLFRMLGSNLAALTRERDLLVETQTYDSRQSNSMLLPGALLSEMTLVL
ncbi:TldD/PmbA family protein [Chitinivorax sp. B]|uniref:TldD/PmbA family protein n=1 Tax=Chitinivorax sp. B TaxID=2502235 RepID=UPI0010F632C1|nr:TldD/PmbA family protein [Chitinivorax sp. B]